MNKLRLYFKSILFSLLTFFAIMIYYNKLYETYDFMIVLLFFIILYFYIKNGTFSDSRTKKYSMFLSIIISLTLSIGTITYRYINNPVISFINIKNILKIIIMTMGFIPFFTRIIYFSFLKLSKVNIIKKDNNMKKLKIIHGFLIALLMIICWLPYFLRFFPAIMTLDSYYIIHNVNHVILSDHHTFGFTWFFGIFFNIGMLIFKNMNLAVMFYTIMQMIILSCIFSFSIRYLYNKGVNKIICIFLFIIYAINPLFGYYSVTLWRDILFSGSVVIICTLLIDYIWNKYKFKLKNVIIMTLAIIMLLFFRNNGIYVLIFSSILIIIFDNSNRGKIALYSIIIISLYFIIKGPVFDYYKVGKSATGEAYSIPLQQIARVLSKKEDISSDEKKYLDSIFNTEYISKVYNPIISDKVKEQMNSEVFNKNKSKFFKVWFTIFLKHPTTYFESYFSSTLGYWYPNVNYWATAGESKAVFDENVESKPIIKIKNFNYLTSRKIPFSLFIWSIGLQFYMLLFATVYKLYIKKFDKKYIIPYIPLWSLWLTMMVASPVFAEYRYMFGVTASIPIVIIYSIINDRKIVDN